MSIGFFIATFKRADMSCCQWDWVVERIILVIILLLQPMQAGARGMVVGILSLMRSLV